MNLDEYLKDLETEGLVIVKAALCDLAREAEMRTMEKYRAMFETWGNERREAGEKAMARAFEQCAQRIGADLRKMRKEKKG